MARHRRCIRLAGAQSSPDDVVLFTDGADADSNLGAAVIFAANHGVSAAAYQKDDWWIVVVPDGAVGSGSTHLLGAHSCQFEDGPDD